MSTNLQSPITYPTTTVGGKAYECRFSFAASRRLAAEKIDERFPLIPVTDETDAATKYLAGQTNITRTLITAACTFGVQAPDGKWQPIGMDWEQLQEAMATEEFTPMVAAINEAFRLAQRMAATAQAATQAKMEPGQQVQ